MPKILSSEASKLRQIANNYDRIFSTDNKVLICIHCGTKVNHTKKYFIEQHLNTKKHKDRVKLRDAAKTQQITSHTVDASKKDDFFADITQWLVACDIPLFKVNHSQFKSFIEKHTSKKCPAEATLRRNYINDLYESVLQKIRADIGDNNIFVSIDETTDKSGRFVCNVIVGALQKNAKPYLLSVEIVDKTNASNVATVFDNALKILWPEGVRREKVFVFVTDGARYMKKCGRALKLLYPKMLHVTCVAHGIHRVCETIRSKYPDVDSFISNVKKIFLKSPIRLSLFKEMHPNIPIPPKPVLTRWSTWLSAAVYYAKYYTEIKQIIEKLEEDAACIIFSKKLISDGRLPEQLAFLQTNFSFLVDPDHGVFLRLQQRDKSIGEIFEIIDFIENNLKQIPGERGKAVLDKFQNVLSQNEDLAVMRNISNVVCGVESVNLPEGIEVKDVVFFNSAPLVSCEVERSFSCYKAFFRDNRMSFLPENLKKYMVPLCYFNNYEHEHISLIP